MVNNSLIGFGGSAQHLCGRTASSGRVVLGVLAYPASFLLVAHLLSDGHLGASATIVLLAAPGRSLGWLVLALRLGSAASIHDEPNSPQADRP